MNVLILQNVHASIFDVVSVTCETVVVAATRLINSNAARIMPACTATVRSANTVSAKVTSHTLTSVLVSLSRDGISSHSPCYRRRPSESPPATAIGTKLTIGAANSRIAKRVSA